MEQIDLFQLLKDDLVVTAKTAMRVELSNHKDVKICAFLAKNIAGEIIFVIHYGILNENGWKKGEELVNIEEFVDAYERYEGMQNDLAEEPSANYKATYDMLKNINNNLVVDQYQFPDLVSL